jgi:hypothetical protein
LTDAEAREVGWGGVCGAKGPHTPPAFGLKRPSARKPDPPLKREEHGELNQSGNLSLGCSAVFPADKRRILTAPASKAS